MASSKTVRLRLAEDGLVFKLVLIDGAEPSALAEAVAARVARHCGTSAAPKGGFYLTSGADPDGAVVPLSSSLPDGLELTLHPVLRPQSSPASASRSRAPSASGERELGEYDPRAPLLPWAEASASSGSPVSQRNRGDTSESRPSFGVLPNGNGCGKAERCEAARQDVNVVQTPSAQQSTPPREPPSTPLGGLFRASSSFGSFSRLWPVADDNKSPSDTQTSEVHTQRMVDSVERFSRLTTDLANERTFLAWMRTTLAAVRTLFTFYSMSGVSEMFQDSLYVSEIGMASVMLIATLTGRWRYTRMKTIINRKVPPRWFGRISITYLYVVLLVVTLITAANIYAGTWRRAR
eukprot:TRINITY_DN10253_c0_g2_i1.p1 TRINITY_DN10253_c0_g2~~TRINITY_DN10253_c0_g2_i1.p1  ORF type:complete len:350 (-),score=62.10 TRINITY_DN10253_c0_g2_i1:324-1373(-)